MQLHWHKWVHSRGTVYLLHATPWGGNTSTRLCGETAIVRRVDKLWHAEWRDAEGRSGWSTCGSPAGARKWLERELDRRSIGLFGEDVIEFVACS